MWKNLIKLSSWFLLCGLLLSCAQGKVYTLNAQIQQQTGKIEIQGTSNLPDKAMILVSWLKPETAEQPNQQIVVQEFAFVEAGTFQATLEPVDPPPPGPYLLRLRFSAGSYDPSGGAVKAEVGEQGENLYGPLVTADEDGKMLVNILKWDYQP